MYSVQGVAVDQGNWKEMPSLWGSPASCWWEKLTDTSPSPDIRARSFTLSDNGPKMGIFIRGKACPKCGGIERHRIKRSFWMRFLPGSKYYLCEHCEVKFFSVLDLVSSTGLLARLPSPDIRACSHSPSSLLTLLLTNTLKWYFSLQSRHLVANCHQQSLSCTWL